MKALCREAQSNKVERAGEQEGTVGLYSKERAGRRGPDLLGLGVLTGRLTRFLGWIPGRTEHFA